MELDATNARPSLLYQHLIRVIAPRPIAWVSTVSAAGRTNLAPFSFFSGVGSRPPSVLFCPANRRDGSPKDTLKNILETREFVINVVPYPLTEQMNASSAELPPEESEFDLTGLALSDSLRVKPPGVADSPARMECRLLQHLALDPGPGGANIVIGELVHLHVANEVLDESGMPDTARLDLVGRLGAALYCRTQEWFELQRPGG